MRVPFCLALTVIASAAAATDVCRTTFQFDSGVALHVEVVPFVRAAHKIARCGQPWPCQIDGRDFFGADGELPVTQVSRMELEIEGKLVSLATSGMFNPWFGAADPQWFRVWRHGKDWVARGFFSDAAGSYVAEWRISSLRARRTVLTNDESRIDRLELEMLQQPVGRVTSRCSRQGTAVGPRGRGLPPVAEPGR